VDYSRTQAESLAGLECTDIVVHLGSAREFESSTILSCPFRLTSSSTISVSVMGISRAHGELPSRDAKNTLLAKQVAEEIENAPTKTVKENWESKEG
jgi:hypothetical protein